MKNMRRTGKPRATDSLDCQCHSGGFGSQHSRNRAQPMFSQVSLLENFVPQITFVCFRLEEPAWRALEISATFDCAFNAYARRGEDRPARDATRREDRHASGRTVCISRSNPR